MFTFLMKAHVPHGRSSLTRTSHMEPRSQMEVSSYTWMGVPQYVRNELPRSSQTCTTTQAFHQLPYLDVNFSSPFEKQLHQMCVPSHSGVVERCLSSLELSGFECSIRVQSADELRLSFLHLALRRGRLLAVDVAITTQRCVSV